MNPFEIGIVGGTGGIGRWFAAFFESEGYPVHVVGRRTDLTFRDLAERCRVVIVAVPIGVTQEVIHRVGPLLDPGALLMDLTSFKAAPVRAMLDASAAEVVGCHPLFGPDVPSLKGQNVAICPARGERWLPWLRDRLGKNGARIVETTPERHDRMMALVQALNHLDTIALGLTLREAGVSPADLEPFTTPIFRMKAAIVEKVFGASPRLYAELIAGNPHTDELLAIYETQLARLKDLLARKDIDGFAAALNPGKGSP
ncbi:MAG TPA: prephenate dehydrogenase/arogenate dehydrogenase family protein [Syntrophales bacterium]|nr:prephenate dehydrogenase/arogenate dehydrogenase family protein [Syntrophales bacterium]